MKFESLPCVFYDGNCGFCHFFVRFALLHMNLKKPLFFSPLSGEAFQQVIEDHPIESLPDSLVVFDPINETLFFKGKGVIFILNRIGKGWKTIATLLNLLPLKLVNWGYDRFARFRYKFSTNTKSACPIVPKYLQQFFKN